MRSCIPQKPPPARTAFSLFWLIASLLKSSRLGQGVSGMPSSPRPAAGETLRHLRAFPGPRLQPRPHTTPHAERRGLTTPLGMHSREVQTTLRADHPLAGAGVPCEPVDLRRD